VTQTISDTTTSPPAFSASRTAAGMSNAELAALWSEARLAYPLYAALAGELGLAALPHPAGELPPARPTRTTFERDLKWLETIDEHLLAYQLRQVPTEVINGSEATLRAFIQRQLKKPHKITVDRDKIDWLLVQYFALCAPEDLYRQEIKLVDVARVLQPVIAAADAAPVEWSAPLDKILSDLEQCQSLRDVMENGIFEQSRLLKDGAGDKFYDPTVLVAFCRFNFLLRRAFIRLLHADLKSMGDAIDILEARGKRTIDCRRAGFSAAETTAQLRYFCANWKQPFQKDYTESSVTRSLEQLLALRTDLEEALRLAHAAGHTTGRCPPAEAAPAEVRRTRGMRPGSLAGKVLATLRGTQPVSSSGGSEADKCLKAIREQLSHAAVAGARSMSTVTLQDTKVLLSSWEVAAFVSEGGQELEDLRRAVIARALLTVSMEQRKRSGEENALASALTLARSEYSYFQGRVAHAKQTNNREAAVNLGISAKRLLSFIEEAENLQS
jgi:hypothetical protein